MRCSRAWMRWLVLVAVLGATLGCRTPRRLSPTPPRPAVRFDVVFDQSEEQIYSPFDVGFSGMSTLAKALRQAGATVSMNSLPLKSFLPSFAGPGAVIVLGPTAHRPYPRESLAAIEAFLLRGGGVLVLVEHDNLFDNAANQNALTRVHGITARYGAAYGRGSARRARAWPRCHSTRWGLRDIEVYVGAPLEISAPAEPILELTDPVAADARVVGARDGALRLAVLGDAEILWNMTPTSGVQHRPNRAFLIRLFRWLAGVSERTGVPAVPASTLATGSRGEVLFDVSSYGLVPDGSPSGLWRFAKALHARGYGIHVGGGVGTDYSRYDLVVLAAPLEAPGHAGEIARARRLLLLGEAGSDMLGEGPGLRRTLRGFIEPGFVAAQPPLNGIGARFGVQWLARTVVSARAPRIFAGARWSDGGPAWRLRRGGVLSPTGASFAAAARIVGRAGPGTWSVKNLVSSRRGPFPRPARLDSAVVALSGARFFATSDVDLLTNQLIGTRDGNALLRRVIRWLTR